MFKSPVWKRSLLGYGEFVHYFAIGQDVFTIIKCAGTDFSSVPPTVHIWTYGEGIVVCGKANNFIILMGRGETITFFFLELVLNFGCPRWCNSGIDDPFTVVYM